MGAVNTWIARGRGSSQAAVPCLLSGVIVRFAGQKIFQSREQRYRTIFDHAHTGIATADASGRFAPIITPLLANKLLAYSVGESPSDNG